MSKFRVAKRKIKSHFICFSDSRADDDQLNDASGRITSTSTIRFRPTAADNGVTWACEAEHQAIVYSPLRASVLLSVLRESIRFDRDYKACCRDSRILLAPKRRPLTLVRRASGSPQISLGFVTARARRSVGRSVC